MTLVLVTDHFSFLAVIVQTILVCSRMRIQLMFLHMQL